MWPSSVVYPWGWLVPFWGCGPCVCRQEIGPHLPRLVFFRSISLFSSFRLDGHAFHTCGDGLRESVRDILYEAGVALRITILVRRLYGTELVPPVAG